MESICALSNGNKIVYEVVNGVCYEKGMVLKDGREEKYATNLTIIEVLRECINTSKRIRIWFGDNDGRAWNEESEVKGVIKLSMGGRYTIPILMANARSHYGSPLMVGRIVRIDDIASRRTLYKQSNFHIGQMRIVENTADAMLNRGYKIAVMQRKADGLDVNIANFKTRKKADRWVAFMKGERYNM